MTSKYFPIKSNTACRLKWSFSTLYLTDGVSSSCHRASHAALTPENFTEFHNLPNKLNDRKTMLAGLWPGNGCEHCRDVELAGGTSDRQFQNTIPDVYPSILDTDSSLVSVEPSILEVFFQNTCNLKCAYCSEKYSSSIEQENKKFGRIEILGERGKLPINRYDEFIDLFWQWMSVNSTTLKRMNILGGEPLIQSDFEKLLEFFEDNPNPNLELSITTNLIIKQKRLIDCADKLNRLLTDKKIKRVDILCSVDGWGKQQEYSRAGFDCAVFEENIISLLKYPFRVSLLSTINALNIRELPELFEKKNQWSKIKQVFWYMHFILPFESHLMRPTIFDYGLWKDAFEQVYDKIPDDNFDDTSTRNVLFGIMQKCKSATPDLHAQKILIEYLYELDRRRGTDWQTTFPWLTKYVV